MAIGPVDYYGDLNPDPDDNREPELPEIDELWRQGWEAETLSTLSPSEAELRRLIRRFSPAA